MDGYPKNSLNAEKVFVVTPDPPKKKAVKEGEAEESAPGDLVEIIECPPRSRTKRWELVRVVAKSTAVDLAALRSGARATELREASVRDEEAKATGQASETTAGGAGDEEGVDE